MLTDNLETLRTDLERKIGKIDTLEALAELETLFLGRKGELTNVLRQLGELPVEERKALGQRANEIKIEAEAWFAAARGRMESAVRSAIGSTERVDVSEPGVRPAEGHLHIVTQTIREITDIFERIGFYRTRYPEIDWDWYAFETLNMPEDHPARDNWETFFMDAPESKLGRMVLIPHTSNAQGHELERKQFPIRMLNIAKCYRRQSDTTHAPMFHQFEGLYVDRDVNLTHLIGIVKYFIESFFGGKRTFRLRPHHFRFTEPSFEVDVSCGICNATGITADGQKCRVCKRGWLEIGGCGMTHPNVLKACKVDPSAYTGLAFGWGIERIAMMKDGINLDDIRTLYENDLRFLKQF
jgi:phenylalanyl-tRNA synthetase alpha chain